MVIVDIRWFFNISTRRLKFRMFCGITYFNKILVLMVIVICNTVTYLVLILSPAVVFQWDTTGKLV